VLTGIGADARHSYGTQRSQAGKHARSRLRECVRERQRGRARERERERERGQTDSKPYTFNMQIVLALMERQNVVALARPTPEEIQVDSML
jgi:hypothetical protein